MEKVLDETGKYTGKYKENPNKTAFFGKRWESTRTQVALPAAYAHVDQANLLALQSTATIPFTPMQAQSAMPSFCSNPPDNDFS